MVYVSSVEKVHIFTISHEHFQYFTQLCNKNLKCFLHLGKRTKANIPRKRIADKCNPKHYKYILNTLIMVFHIHWPDVMLCKIQNLVPMLYIHKCQNCWLYSAMINLRLTIEKLNSVIVAHHLVAQRQNLVTNCPV